MKYYFYRPCSTTSFSHPFDDLLTLAGFPSLFLLFYYIASPSFCSFTE